MLFEVWDQAYILKDTMVLTELNINTLSFQALNTKADGILKSHYLAFQLEV